jgi:hypothetical protein
VLRVRAWEAANPVRRRVYKRTWDQARKRAEYRQDTGASQQSAENCSEKP